ncbi:double zinc ribbon domain-containing protein [Haloarcula brevis]|uniref:double zinc ribbon domain-containing protein n=1 Tax=Haloarcula brevis TaxID=3111453 RepID=UPI00300ECB25
MPESDRTVNCPICDEDFDPTVAGGWCTNPDCGEWQHTDRAATDDGESGDADLLAAEADETAGAAGNDEPAADGDSGIGAVEADDAAETGQAAETDAEPADEDDDADAPADDEPATITCPDCDRELDADANFCIDCGTDVQDVTPGEEGALDACPSCDTAVDDDASFCVNCGENLDAHRDAGGAAAADSGPESPTAEPDDAVDAPVSQATGDATPPEGLVLSVEGRDITVEDGARIGREIRAALLDAGRPEDEAVRIHREHVRFDRQPEGYYLVDLGDNPTRLNGTLLQKGDREPIQPGDELELSGVATLTIRAA